MIFGAGAAVGSLGGAAAFALANLACRFSSSIERMSRASGSLKDCMAHPLSDSLQRPVLSSAALIKE